MFVVICITWDSKCYSFLHYRPISYQRFVSVLSVEPQCPQVDKSLNEQTYYI